MVIQNEKLYFLQGTVWSTGIVSRLLVLYSALLIASFFDQVLTRLFGQGLQAPVLAAGDGQLSLFTFLAFQNHWTTNLWYASQFAMEYLQYSRSYFSTTWHTSTQIHVKKSLKFPNIYLESMRGHSIRILVQQDKVRRTRKLSVDTRCHFYLLLETEKISMTQTLCQNSWANDACWVCAGVR